MGTLDLFGVGNIRSVWSERVESVTIFRQDTLVVSFAEIIIIVLDSALAKFHQLLPSVCNPKLKLDFVTIPDDGDMGTADALRHIQDKIEVSTKM